MLSNWAIKRLEHLTLDYMKFDCKEGSCYGVIGVRNKNGSEAPEFITLSVGSSYIICTCLISRHTWLFIDWCA